MYEQALGPTHPNTVTMRNNLAALDAQLAMSTAADEAAP